MLLSRERPGNGFHLTWNRDLPWVPFICSILLQRHRPDVQKSPGSVGASVIEQRDQPSLWNWPEDDALVNLSTFVLKEWKHPGDSPIALARPRKRHGELTPPPAYLLKWGRDAIGERLYSLVACHLNLPSTVV